MDNQDAVVTTSTNAAAADAAAEAAWLESFGNRPDDDQTTVAPKAKEPPKAKSAEPPADDADSDDDDADDSDDADDTADDQSDDSDAEDDDDADADAEFEEDFKTEFKKHGINIAALTADLDGPAKAIVTKRLKEVQRGFTLATQQVRERIPQLEEEVANFDKNFVDIAFIKFAEDPSLLEAINALFPDEPQYLDNGEGGHTLNPAWAPSLAKSARLQKLELKEKRDAVAATLKTERDAKAAQDRRTEEIDRDATAAARALGLPKVTEGMQLAIEKLRASQNGNISREDVKAIVKRHFKELHGTSRKLARDASAANAKDQVKRAKEGALPIRPKDGSPPGVAKAEKPKNDAEFIERYSSS